jgi:hypothetical protein
LCNRQSEFQSIQTSNFCATEIEFQYIQTANICATDIRFQLGLLEVFKIPKDLQSFGTAKISNLCDIHRTEYFINFQTLGYLEIDCSSMSEAIAVQR